MVYLHRYLVSRDQMGISPLYYKDNSMQAVVQKLTTSQNKKVPKYKRRPLATFVLNRYAVLPYACAWSFNATFICNLHPWERTLRLHQADSSVVYVRNYAHRTNPPHSLTLSLFLLILFIAAVLCPDLKLGFAPLLQQMPSFTAGFFAI